MPGMAASLTFGSALGAASAVLLIGRLTVWIQAWERKFEHCTSKEGSLMNIQNKESVEERKKPEPVNERKGKEDGKQWRSNFPGQLRRNTCP
jgi:hypothetical protein